MSPLMTVGEFALATGLSAKAHAAELRRRRDLEDRALALAVAGVYAAPDPDDDGGPARPGPVAERTVGPTPWAGVVQRVALDEAGEEATTERANNAFATLFQALAEAGSAPAGPLWTALRPVPGAADVVETVLAVPLSGPAPAGLRVDGHEVVTGTLPRRVERYVDVRAAPGG
ncbi:hypothetical protein M3A80_007345, partial [Micrococcus luteus]|nr:hypothetical protein [Micrococcus luteus]